MEKGRTEIVDVTFEDEKAPFLFVVPYFDKSIISSWGEEGELGMEVDSSARSIVSLNGDRDTSNLATQIFIL